MALNEMENGAFFVKVKSKSRRRTCFIQLSQDHLSLLVSRRSCGRKNFKNIDIKKITEIRVGHQSPVWESLGRHLPDVELCFSFVLENKTDPINLAATTASSASNWIVGLKHLNSKLENLDVEGKQMLWVWEHFKQADKDENNQLSYKEIKKLLLQLNVEATSAYIESNLKEFDVSGDDHLSFEEFTAFFKKITWRPEIERLYKTYSDADLKLQANELLKFLRVDQGLCYISTEDVKEFIKKYEADNSFRSEGVMSVYGFTNFLASPLGDIFNFAHRKIFMDMSQPLSHYFVASSHNTYLSDDQLFGKSSVECYVRALERGCRCVELDCWDGEDGEPIVYHGYTLTSKIKFRDVIEAIRDYAFKVSEYPVILSIENHCSIAQQTRMAEILKSLLGSALLTQPVDKHETCLPSPEALKGKILIKGKRLPPECSSDGEVSDEDEAADVEENGVKRKQKSKKRMKLSYALSSLVVYAISRHFKGFEDAKSKSDHNFISSLNEDKAMNLALTNTDQFIKHNAWQLVRIYPRGSRTNSSNYDPQPLWNVGCQIVALNYQTDGYETYLNEARFRSNGGCGYVLKPPCLLSADDFNPFNVQTTSVYDDDPIEVVIRIISAQQLPKPPKNSTDVIDPYIVVSILGCQLDQQRQKSSVIHNNGFNPAWINDPPMTFTVMVPSLAFLQFVVMDKDLRGEDDFVGIYTLTVNDIATGYRHIHLQTTGRKDLSPATLFIHISKKKLKSTKL